MKSCLPAILLLSLFTLTGCVVAIGNAPACETCPDCPNHVSTDLDARIDAAKSITSFSDKDEALSVIAVDAAQQCDVHHAVKALSLMTSFSDRDAAAEKCADIFLAQHLIPEARKVANQMTSFSDKDRVLSKIAQAPDPVPADE